MKKWTGIAAGLALWASARGETFEVQHWTGAFRASIWDRAYTRGLGAAAGVETHFFWNSLAAAQLGYSHFERRYDNQVVAKTVEEIEATVGLKREFHPSSEETLFPRLGIHLGTSRNWNEELHLIVGADAEGVIPVGKAWSIVAAFQPSFSLGSDNVTFWRFSLGALFDVKP